MISVTSNGAMNAASGSARTSRSATRAPTVSVLLDLEGGRAETPLGTQRANGGGLAETLGGDGKGSYSHLEVNRQSDEGVELSEGRSPPDRQAVSLHCAEVS